MFFARFGFFHQVERAGIGVGDIARFAENQREQGIDIALGRKRHADLQQFFQLFFGAFLIFATRAEFSRLIFLRERRCFFLGIGNIYARDGSV